jgi:predicted RNA-binding Zn-ribbon protein involved in translation (DUF1610 family)
VSFFGPPDIGKLKKEGDIRGLIKALGDVDTNIDAHKTLVEIGAPAVRQLVAALKGEGVPGFAALVLEDIGAPSVEPLIRVLVRKDPQVQVLALRALGKIGDDRAVKPIQSILIYILLHEVKIDIVDAAVEALERLGHPAGGGGKLSLKAFKEELVRRGFEKRPRSQRLYANPRYPNLRFRIQERVVRLEGVNPMETGEKWGLVRSFSMARELPLALLVTDHFEEDLDPLAERGFSSFSRKIGHIMTFRYFIGASSVLLAIVFYGNLMEKITFEGAVKYCVGGFLIFFFAVVMLIFIRKLISYPDFTCPICGNRVEIKHSKIKITRGVDQTVICPGCGRKATRGVHMDPSSDWY